MSTPVGKSAIYYLWVHLISCIVSIGPSNNVKKALCAMGLISRLYEYLVYVQIRVHEHEGWGHHSNSVTDGVCRSRVNELDTTM